MFIPESASISSTQGCATKLSPFEKYQVPLHAVCVFWFRAAKSQSTPFATILARSAGVFFQEIIHQVLNRYDLVHGVVTAQINGVRRRTPSLINRAMK